mgnify:CR=1 FL=1
MGDKKILLLLSKFSDSASKAISFFTGFYYTHASIGLSEDRNTFYSFVLKGFIVEKITRYIERKTVKVPCELYEMEVSDEVYETARTALSDFNERKKEFHYSVFGLILSLFHIPHKSRRAFFCSQFVADILKNSRAVKLRKSSSLYFPRDLRKLQGTKLAFRGNLQELTEQYRLCPA